MKNVMNVICKASTHPDEQDLANARKVFSEIKAKMSGEIN